MNRKTRRALQVEQHSFVRQFPHELTLIPPEEWPWHPPECQKVWRSCKYLVQLYVTPEPGVLRLSVSRAKLGVQGRWQDGLSWDELQAIKREVGFGDAYAIEVYPRDRDLVNDANMRHLWLLPKPLRIGWFK